MINTQFSHEQESSSDMRNSFSQLMEKPSTKPGYSAFLKSSWLDSPLGSMLVISDEKSLYLLEFVNGKSLEHEIKWLREKTKSIIVPGNTRPIDSIKKELEQYFSGDLNMFKTPLALLGSPFQQKVWEALKKIPFGQTQSYANIANAIGQPTAFRAVARANGANQLAIVIPCHRVINSNGNLGGYDGGVLRKKWLLEHESALEK